ncbi:helicase SNF2 [Haloferax sp. MBLA0076]|uniref:Helicase SNF2 n=1 Tax=Haloferax litoreum TaxID=2666140 RepID=A0A6A8GCI2_9EURY|nr:MULTISPECIES: helicase-related protein [Haloferax]KAB1192416.1 helicase SNF2 [Haloferax sp. CBA1148]MRX20883.1 helicase SNF2 [Haloferax litoreum]
MPYLDPLVDNSERTLEDTFKEVITDSEEVRVATGYFYLSGFDLVKDDLNKLLDPDDLGKAPMRILMGRQTDARTANEIEEGQSLHEQFRNQLKSDLADLNNAQIERLDRLRDFIEQGLVDVRIRNPENGYFHAKGASFRTATDDPSKRNGETDRRDAAVIVGSSNFTQTGHRHNIELNLTSSDPQKVEAFEEWYDNQWAISEEFSREIVDVIENSSKYQDWKEDQEDDKEDDEVDFGTYIEPFELYKVLSYDAIGGNVSARDSPLYYFQTIGYESAWEKLAQYNGCIISDSVGLGKSFIGSELLFDYRQQGKRCLLIVPANLTDQWEDLLQDATDEDGDPYFGLEVDGTHLDVTSISKFQNMSHDEVLELREQYDVLLIDEAHRFRNYGKWRPNPSDDDDYKGTRRHANLRLLRDKTMILLTATPLNNSATDLKNLIGLFTEKNEIRNKANLDFTAFDRYIDVAEQRKRVAAGKEEMSQEEVEGLTEQLQNESGEISKILNEVMVLRTRKHVKETLLKKDDDLEMSFKPPKIQKEEYTLPPAYRPVYDSLPEVMDALHLPHITIKNPQAGSTLKALYKLNLLKRLESSTFAFVQSIETLYESEQSLLAVLNSLPDEENIDTLRTIQDGGAAVTLDDYVQDGEATEDLAQTLEEFGFDADSLRSGDGDSSDELADLTVAEVKARVYEDLALLSYFLQLFIADVAKDADHLNDHSVHVRQWLGKNHVGFIPDVPEDEVDPLLFPSQDLSEVTKETRDFYDAIFRLRDFRDPKIDRLNGVLAGYDNKVLVFTQYRATADYVYRTLLEDPRSPLTEQNSTVIKGGDDDKQEKIRRFAPDAYGYRETLDRTGDGELQYVVATDTLSEGVNLQDVHTVINYDLPWNPMRIVQRVGRIDRIGSTADKFVHNFYPDGDIEAAIKLLKRLQAKINDIALIVGKENNILDPNEDEILEKAGVKTQKTIGELELDEIEDTLRRSREVDDYNDLDDTSKNPLLRSAGSDEDEAFERLMLKQELNDDYGLGEEDFEYAEEYFEMPPEERDLLYTNVVNSKSGHAPGVFGLAHLWFDDESDAPLGRTRRAFYSKRTGKDVDEVSAIRSLKINPDTEGRKLTSHDKRYLEERDAIEEVVEKRIEEAKQGIIGTKFEEGDDYSVEQEKIISYLRHLKRNSSGELATPVDGHTEISVVAPIVLERIKEVKLKNTDEDRILRETFRKEDKGLGQWDLDEFFETLVEFLDENIEGSTEYQSKLAGTGDVDARVLCWGVLEQ